MSIRIIMEKDGVEIQSLELTDHQTKCLKNDLPGDMGIWAWVKGLIDGKVNQCAKRLEPAALSEVRSRGLSPASMSQEDIIAAWAGHPDYRDREAHEVIRKKSEKAAENTRPPA